jgi:dTDP-4-dehydrorhamnose 3,5-epimerase
MEELFTQTPIKDLLIYTPRIIRDQRGYFCESFNDRHFKKVGVTAPFVQDNRSFSTQGTLRGLHMQMGEAAQAKLVGVLSGVVFDVAVDLRKGSDTFAQHYSITLDAIQGPKFLYIPRGFAHGFLVLSETAEFYYRVDNYYCREHEAGVRYDDPSLSISWPKLDTPYLLSEKDQLLPHLSEWKTQQGF